MKIKFSHLLPLLLIIITTFFVWHKLLNQAPAGEGYYYFDTGQNFITDGRVSSLWGLDNFAKLIFDILPILIGDNLTGYFAFQLITMILLNLTIFLVVNYFTKNKWVSFATTIFFLCSFIGLFEMLGSGNYQRFVQRVPNLIPLLFAFQQLVEFLQSHKIKNYLYSLLLFTLAMLMAHFSSFFLPLFIIYPLFFTLSKFQNLKQALINISFTLPFIAINLILVSHDEHTPHNNVFLFLSSYGPARLLQDILLQFTSINIPPFIIQKIASIIYPYKNTVTVLAIPLVAFYLVGVKLIKSRAPNLMPFYLTSVVMIPVLLFLNLYLGKVDPIYDIRGYNYYYLPPSYPNSAIFTNSIKGDRYYLLPMIFVSIIWSLLIWLFFKNKSRLIFFNYQNILSLILLSYVFYNTSLIWGNMDIISFNSNLMKNYIKYIKLLAPKLDANSVIVAPRPLIWPSSFVRFFYTNPNVKFIVLKEGWEKEINLKNKADLFVLNYDPQNWQIIDQSKEYREKLD